ncbi:serine-enriched protein-like [Argopecten irradians]|uniref:serine-enriched protein-like n=1 Tax=Argopecten irradians TaxID=31199 RepID=UPI003716F2B0
MLCINRVGLTTLVINLRFAFHYLPRSNYSNSCSLTTMEKSESRALLIQNDELDILTTEHSDNDDIGFSSGYESNPESSPEVGDSSDQETDNNVRDSVNYNSTSALCDRLKYILSMPELCDVTFLVGPTKVPVYGVKAILGTRSRVIYQLILQKQKEEEENRTKKSRKSRNGSHLVIDVKKYEPEDFRKIVQFIHCGSVDVTVKNVTGLLCGASQFKLMDLKFACWDFVKRCLNAENGSVAAIRKCAEQYSQHKTAGKLFSKISSHLENTSQESDSTSSSSTSSTSSSFVGSSPVSSSPSSLPKTTTV